MKADQKRQRCQFSEEISVFFRHDRNDFLSPGDHERKLVISLWPETKQQSIKWEHGGSPRSKNSEYKNPLEKSSPRFFGIKRAKLSTQRTIRLCWCNWRTFWWKNDAGNSPKGSCSYTTMPLLTGHLQPRRNWPTWASSFLITHPILRIWPRRNTTCSLDWKNNWKVKIFRPTRRSFRPRRPGWTDNVLNFIFTGLQKLEQ